MKLLGLLLVLLSVSCSNTQTRTPASAAEERVIPLHSFIDDLGEYEPNSKTHTVYDYYVKSESFKVNTPQELAQSMSAPFEFYTVHNKNETLRSIAKKIYGSDKKLKELHSWNYDLLPSHKDIKVGMRIKYLPQDRRPASSK